MTSREDRIVSNELLFREVNEHVNELARRVSILSTLDYACECGRPGCAERTSLTHGEYEQVRSDAQRFLTLPGHETPSLERAVERYESYQVVEKTEQVAAERAEQTDPR